MASKMSIRPVFVDHNRSASRARVVQPAKGYILISQHIAVSARSPDQLNALQHSPVTTATMSPPEPNQSNEKGRIISIEKLCSLRPIRHTIKLVSGDHISHHSYLIDVGIVSQEQTERGILIL
jgi:hypothetical protein